MVNPVCRMAFVVGSAGSGTPSEGEGEGEREGGRESGIHVYMYTFIYVFSTQWSPEVCIQ